jgi:hypothetical protein
MIMIETSNSVNSLLSIFFLSALFDYHSIHFEYFPREKTAQRTHTGNAREAPTLSRYGAQILQFALRGLSDETILLTIIGSLGLMSLLPLAREYGLGPVVAILIGTAIFGLGGIVRGRWLKRAAIQKIKTNRINYWIGQRLRKANGQSNEYAMRKTYNELRDLGRDL